MDIFNIIASTISKIKDKNYDQYFQKSNAWHTNCEKDIQIQLPELYYKDNENLIVLPLTLTLIRDNNLLKKISNLINNYFTIDDICKIMKLLNILDDALENVIKNRYQIEDNFIEVPSLNSNTDETNIVILPNVPCSWKRASNGCQHGYKINHCLHNIYCIINSNLKGLCIKNIFLDETVFYRAKKNNKLKIACSPVTNQEIVSKINEITDENGDCYFSVSSIKNKNLLKEKVLKIIKKCMSDNVDILVFPELLGFEKLNDEAISLVKNDIFSQYPPLIVLPSVWKDKTNVSDIIIDNGAKIIKQAKQNGMTFNGLCEYIIPNKILYVIHCRGIGRICILICKDMLVLDYLDIILKDIQASLIIVPSFSTGNYDFQNAIAHCQTYDCDVIWINSCAAIHLDYTKKENFKIIGAVLKSGKGSNSIDKFCKNEKCKNCNKEICIFKTDIPLIYNR